VLQAFVGGITSYVGTLESVDRVLKSYQLDLVRCLYELEEVCGSICRDVAGNAGDHVSNSLGLGA
jgi:hypothetical protein